VRVAIAREDDDLSVRIVPDRLVEEIGKVVLLGVSAAAQLGK
jgi:hypothetical protein